MTLTQPIPAPVVDTATIRDHLHAAVARAEAEALVALYDERIALTKALANAPQPTGAMAQAVLDKGAELDAACEAFRRRHYPRKHRVVVGLRTVMAVSRTARSIVTVYDANEAPR